MNCSDCGANRWRVIKTWRGRHEISRRRECLECGYQEREAAITAAPSQLEAVRPPAFGPLEAPVAEELCR